MSLRRVTLHGRQHRAQSAIFDSRRQGNMGITYQKGTCSGLQAGRALDSGKTFDKLFASRGGIV